MAKRKTGSKVRETPPAKTPEGRENQLIAAAMDLAEQQILDGTASPSVITHFLKLGSTREQKEQRMLEGKTELVFAQKDSLESSKRIEELYSKAIDAMRIYSGEVIGG